MTQQGPLAGIRVLELAGIGPAPYAATMLAELGAEVLRVDRPGGAGPAVSDVEPLNRLSRDNLFCTVRDTRFARFETRGCARFGSSGSGLVGDVGGTQRLSHAHGVPGSLDQMRDRKSGV